MCLAGFSAVIVTAATIHFSKTLTITIQPPVGTAPKDIPVEVITLEDGAESDVTENSPSDNTVPKVRNSYIFTPVWDTGAYRHEGSPVEIPTITVTFETIPGTTLSFPCCRAMATNFICTMISMDRIPVLFSVSAGGGTEI